MKEKKHTVQRFLDLIKRYRRGRCKVYPGMSAGVGKTYRVLQVADEVVNIDLPAGELINRLRNEKFMACICSNEETTRMIIRKTARLASYCGAGWVALYVQPPPRKPATGSAWPASAI